jgi:hypothetical protein
MPCGCSLPAGILELSLVLGPIGACRTWWPHSIAAATLWLGVIGVAAWGEATNSGSSALLEAFLAVGSAAVVSEEVHPRNLLVVADIVEMASASTSQPASQPGILYETAFLYTPQLGDASGCRAAGGSTSTHRDKHHLTTCLPPRSHTPQS